MYKQEEILHGGLKMLLNRCMFPLPWISTNTIELWSDVSGIGAGATLGNQWICIPFTGDKAHFKQFPIV